MSTKARAKPQIDGEAVYATVREMAVEYRFRPGEDIRDTDLAARLGVSRTPVRAALWRLVGEGLVEARPGRGFRCRNMGTEEVSALLSVALRLSTDLVEPALAAPEAARSARLADAEAALETAPALPPCERARAEERGHAAFAALSGDPAAGPLLAMVHARLRFFRKIVLVDDADAKDAFAAQRDLARALAAGEADAARAALARPLTMDRAEVEAVLMRGLGRLYLGDG